MEMHVNVISLLNYLDNNMLLTVPLLEHRAKPEKILLIYLPCKFQCSAPFTFVITLFPYTMEPSKFGAIRNSG